MKSVTVAGIDCGTNSIRLKIARVDDQGMHEIVPRILRVIRLGQDVDKTHRFAQDALDRAYTAAAEFAGVLAQHPVDAIRFVATSATRDAVNRDTFEDGIEQILGVRPELDALVIDPCIPRAWSRFQITRRFRGMNIDITVENPRHICRGVRSLTVDGKSVDGNRVPLSLLRDGAVVRAELA